MQDINAGLPEWRQQMRSDTKYTSGDEIVQWKTLIELDRCEAASQLGEPYAIEFKVISSQPWLWSTRTPFLLLWWFFGW